MAHPSNGQSTVVLPSIHEILPPHLLPRRLWLCPERLHPQFPAHSDSYSATTGLVLPPLTFPPAPSPAPPPRNPSPALTSASWDQTTPLQSSSSPEAQTPPPSTVTVEEEPQLDSDPEDVDMEDSADSDAAQSATSGNGREIARAATPSSQETQEPKPPRKNHGRKHCCSLCNKRFNRPSSLKIHVNTHTGAMPFTCPHPGCGRAFNVNSNMRRHFRNHASPSGRTTLRTVGDVFHNTYAYGAGVDSSLSLSDPGTTGNGTDAVGVTSYVYAAFLAAERLPNQASTSITTALALALTRSPGHEGSGSSPISISTPTSAADSDSAASLPSPLLLRPVSPETAAPGPL